MDACMQFFKRLRKFSDTAGKNLVKLPCIFEIIPFFEEENNNRFWVHRGGK